MSVKSKLYSFLSLSAASIALLQSIASSKGKPLELPAEGINQGSAIGIESKGEQLILAPAHQEELLRLYAGHRSHSSHSSHRSHSSHYSGASGYSYPTAPRAPSGGYYYVPPKPSPGSPAAPANPNRVPVTPAVPARPRPAIVHTNLTSATNSSSLESSTNYWNITLLKKQAAEGSSDAQFSLGVCYLHGIHGVNMDTERAKMLFEMSADQGNMTAKSKLQELARAATEDTTKTLLLEKPEKQSGGQTNR